MNHFLMLPESGDQSLRESFATAMKHSVRTQKRYYDEQPLAQKKSRALDFLASMASQGPGEVSVELLNDSDEEGNVEYLPKRGEFVALVAANSTESAPEVFVAKVVRLSEDQKIAIQAEFSELRPGRYKLRVGRSYSTENLSTPLFIQQTLSICILKANTNSGQAKSTSIVRCIKHRRVNLSVFYF